MRENRPYGSEGGGTGQPALPTPIEKTVAGKRALRLFKCHSGQPPFICSFPLILHHSFRAHGVFPASVFPASPRAIRSGGPADSGRGRRLSSVSSLLGNVSPPSGPPGSGWHRRSVGMESSAAINTCGPPHFVFLSRHFSSPSGFRALFRLLCRRCRCSPIPFTVQRGSARTGCSRRVSCTVRGAVSISAAKRRRRSCGM